MSLKKLGNKFGANKHYTDAKTMSEVPCPGVATCQRHRLLIVHYIGPDVVMKMRMVGSPKIMSTSQGCGQLFYALGQFRRWAGPKVELWPR